MSEAKNAPSKRAVAKPIKGHIKPGTELKPGSAAHTALLRSAGLAPATTPKPASKKPVVSDLKRP